MRFSWKCTTIRQRPLATDPTSFLYHDWRSCLERSSRFTNLLITMIERNEVGNAPRLLLLILSSVVSVMATSNLFAQDCESPSKESSIVSIGANAVLVYRSPGPVRLMAGRVVDGNGMPFSNAIVDVFPLKKSLRRSLARPGVGVNDPVRSYKTNERGEFCLDGFPDGSYELRFGTDEFAYNHAIMKVRKARSGSAKWIDVTLT